MPTTECHGCRQKLERPEWKLKRYAKQFCNNKCRGRWMSTQTGTKARRYVHGQSGGSKTECILCAKVFTRTFYKQRYCGNSCQMKHEYQTGIRKPTLGETHGLWTETPSYSAVHTWVRKHKPKPKACEACGVQTTKLDAANLSGEYKRDIKDYAYLCRRCHMKQDGRIQG